MPITAEQAKQELRRRQAIAELRKRGLLGPEDANIPQETGTPTTGDAGGLSGQDRGVSRIITEPISPEEQANYEKQEWLREKIAAGEIEPVPPTYWERFKEDIPQMAGGTIGGMAGAKAGAMAGAKIPAGHPVLKGGAILGGAVLGAGIGGMGGKGYQQYYRMTHPGAKPMTFGEIYTEQAIAGIEEAASELAGRGIAKIGTRILGKLGKPFARKMIAPHAKEVTKALTKHGAQPTLAQITDVRLLDIMEAVAEGSFFGGGKVQKLKTRLLPEALMKYVGSVSDDFAKGLTRKLTPDEIGDLLLDTINQKNSAFKQTSKAIYKQVDKLLRRSGKTSDIVNILPLKKFAQQRLTSKLAISRSMMGDTLLDSISKLPDKVTFKQATSLRSALMAQTRSMTATKDVALGISKQLTKMTDNAINTAGKELPEDALKMWRFANQFHRSGKQQFTTKLIKSLTRNLADNPEIAVRKIFRPNAVTQIQQLRKIVDEPTWRALKYGYVDNMIKSSLDETGIVSGNKVLSKLNSMGEKTLKSIFSPEELKSVRLIGEAAKMIQSPTQPFAATGRMLITLTQAGFLVRFGKEGIPFLVGPWAFARIATSPKWSKLLIAGMKAPEKSGALVTRLINVSRRLELQKKAVNEKYRKEQSSQYHKSPELRQLRGFGGRGF